MELCPHLGIFLFSLRNQGPAGELAQWLRALLMIAKDLDLIPCAHMEAYHLPGKQAQTWYTDIHVDNKSTFSQVVVVVHAFNPSTREAGGSL